MGRARIATVLPVLVVVAVFAVGCAGLGMMETAEALFQAGKQLFEDGKYDEAIQKFREALTRNARYWQAYLYLARSYIAKADWRPAVDSARRAFEIAPREQGVAPALGQALVGAGLDALARRQFDEAVRYLGESVRHEPTNPRGYYHLARAHLGAGSFGEALTQITRGLGQAGGDAGARRDLTTALLDGGRQALQARDWRSAIALLGEHVRLDPSNASAFLDLGKAYWNAGERLDALGAFRRVLELSPTNEEARRFLGR